MADDILGKIGGFAADAGVDTAADGAINGVLDGIASHIPGGSAVEGMLKTGIDFEANTLINGEMTKITGHAQTVEPAAEPAPDTSAQ
jgi:hypothetical protein